jgi:chemotaxis protein MotB
MQRGQGEYYGTGYEQPVMQQRRSRGWLAWLFLLLVLGATAAFVYYMYLPLRRAKDGLAAQHGEALGKTKHVTKQLRESEAKLEELRRDQQRLSGQLAQTVAEKEKIESELKRVQGELSEKLEPEIQKGNVRIKRRGNELVVDVADQILFDVGQADVNAQGQKVLAQVAQTLAQLGGYSIQVGGHTDSARVTSPTTQERFPTNWELSTARATNVVRFLQERAKIPGERLVAAGFAQFRPTAANSSAEGRQKNRRIEIVLLRTSSESTVR